MPVTLPRLLLLSSVVVPGSVLGQSDDTIRSSLQTVAIPSGRVETVFHDDRHFEAPNWSPDGRFFVVNSKGRLGFRTSIDGCLSRSRRSSANLSKEVSAVR